MSHSVVGRTRVDSAVADYLRSLLGDEISTEGWEIDASRAGDVYLLRVHFTTTVSTWPTVFDRLAPHVKGFSAHVGDHKGKPGGLRISAALMINIVEFVKIMAARLESDK